MRHVGMRLIFALLFTGLIVVLSGCPLPIDAAIAAQLSDKSVPDIIILSPESGEAYSQTVSLVLQINDSSGSASGGVSGIDVAVSTGLSSLISEQVDPTGIDTEGIISFDLELDTQDFSGPIVIRVVVSDWNDNISEAEVTLDDPGNDIPSFVVVPGSEEVALSWQGAPEASSYTLFYSTNGTLPSETYGLKIAGITESYTSESPLVISELRNGSLHVFQLQAITDGGDSWYSDFVQVIPLSPFTVAPNTFEEYGKIALQWQRIPGASQFEVTRATSLNGVYINVSGILSGYTFVDEDVEIGTEYYYKVRPNVPDAIYSASSSATPSPFVPATDRTIDFVDTPGNASRVEIAGDYAFVVDYSKNVQVVDISNPADLRLVASVGDPTQSEYAFDLTIQGDYLYVARGSSGLGIYDISDPTSPQLLSLTDMLSGFGRTAYGVVVSGDFAFLSCTDYGVVVLDVSDPTDPTIMADAGYAGSTTDIAISGQYVYAVDDAAGDNEFVVLNMQDVDAPDLVFVRSELLEVNGDAQELTVVGDRLLVSRDLNITVGGGVEVWDISTADNPVRSGVVLTPDYRRALDSYLVNDVLYVAVASSDYGLVAYDISDVANPRLLFNVGLPSGGSGLRLVGDIALVGIGSFGLQAVDVRLPPTPVLRNSPNTLTATSDLVVRSGYGYLANESNVAPMLTVLDLNNPADPTVVGTSSGNARGTGVVLRGDYAFVSGYPGLTVFDISNPLAPVFLGEYETPGYANDVALLGDFAIVADDTHGIQIVSVADPTAPRYSQYVNTGRSYAVAVANGYAFVGSTSSPGGVYVIDMSAPLEAAKVGLYSGFPAYFLSAGRERMAVSSSQAWGMVMLNTREPEVLVDIGDIGSGAEAYIASYPPYDDGGGNYPTPEGIAMSGDYAFGVDWPEESIPGMGDGLHILDISSPVNGRRLQDVEGLFTSGAAGVWTSGSRLYVLDWADGLLVFDL
jgi:hypothetical protein